MPTAAKFVITQGDRAPALVVTLLDAAGAPVNLTAASGVTFTMRDASLGAIKVNAGAATFVDQAGGQVSYAWAAGDTDTVGSYEAKFTVTWNDATQTSFPTDEGAQYNYITVTVVDDAGTVG